MQYETPNQNPANLDTLDDLYKLTSQARAIVTILLSDDNHRTLPPGIVSDALWLARDRLRGIQDSLYKLK